MPRTLTKKTQAADPPAPFFFPIPQPPVCKHQARRHRNNLDPESGSLILESLDNQPLLQSGKVAPTPPVGGPRL